MKLVNTREDLLLYIYGTNETMNIANYRFDADTRVEVDIFEAEILFLLEGNITINFGEVKNLTMKSNQMVLLPNLQKIKANVNEDSHILVFRVRHGIPFWDENSMKSLITESPNAVRKVVLPINKHINSFLNTFISYLEDGINSQNFTDIKSQELFHLLKAYYMKEEFAGFFLPLLNYDSLFSVFVYENHLNVKNVKEFAALFNSSVSCFEKQFKKVFGVSPYTWMKQKKSELIYHELIHTNKSFKELCMEYHFSSLTQFNDFCKRNFNSTPGKIRKNNSGDFF